MAVLWQKKLNGNKYEVRSAGRTRRLYTNGVCHSEYNPHQVLSGSIWDLLTIPAFFYSAESIKRILVLGAGGGAVVKQISALLQPRLIIAIELEPVHIYVAQRFFEVDGDHIQLLEADARVWLQDYKGPPFDLIIEDLFTEQGQQPARVAEIDAHWLGLLEHHLTDAGRLVINFVSRTEFMSAAYFTQSRYRYLFASVFQLTVPQLDNYVGVFLKRQGESAVLRENLRCIPLCARALTERRLNYRIRNLTL